MSSFDVSLRKLNQVVDDDLEVSIIPSPRATRGDVTTVAEIEGLSYDGEWVDTKQHTIQFLNDSSEYYAEVIIHILQDVPAALIEWIEVVDREHRGNGIGRALHEEAVQYIDTKTDVERIYTKIKNPKMQSANIDTGFRQIDVDDKYPWYMRE